MAIGYASYLDHHYRENLLDIITNVDPLAGSIICKPQRVNKPWQPPVYTNLTSWMFLNYFVLACVLALVASITMAVAQ